MDKKTGEMFSGRDACRMIGGKNCPEFLVAKASLEMRNSWPYSVSLSAGHNFQFRHKSLFQIIILLSKRQYQNIKTDISQLQYVLVLFIISCLFQRAVGSGSRRTASRSGECSCRVPATAGTSWPAPASSTRRETVSHFMILVT